MKFSNRMQQQVAEFMLATGDPVGGDPIIRDTPGFPSKERIELCCRLIQEEASEVNEALAAYVAFEDKLDKAEALAPLAKEIADFVYVCLYAANACGLETASDANFAWKQCDMRQRKIPLENLTKDPAWKLVNRAAYTSRIFINSSDVWLLEGSIYSAISAAFEMSGILGFDLVRVFDAVHASNMTKLGDDGKAVRDEGGKVCKGPNYKPADIVAVLRGQKL